MVTAPSDYYSVMNNGTKQITDCASYYSDKWVSLFLNGQTLLDYAWQILGVSIFVYRNNFYMNIRMIMASRWNLRFSKDDRIIRQQIKISWY